MLLRELLAVPELELRLLHGDDLALERGVRWVYTTDLIDPARYLSGGELVISGLVWRGTPADSERFVRALADVGVAALAAGEAVFHGIPADLLAACRRRDVVLIAVPENTSFAAVTERVIGSVTADRNDRLANTLARQRMLLSAVAEGLGLDDVAAQVSNAAGTPCRVVTATGRHVVTGPAPLPSADIDRLTRAFLTADRLPTTTTSAGTLTYSILPIGPALEQRMAAWFVVAEGIWSHWDRRVTDAVADLVTIAALDRARRAEGARIARNIADDAIALVGAGAGGQPETAVRMRQAGLDPQLLIGVAVAKFAGRPDLTEAARAVLDDAAAHLGTPVVGTTSDGAAVALLPSPGPAGITAFRAALARVEPGMGRLRLTVGMSEPTSVTALSGALEEAHHARRLAELRADRVSVVTGADVTSHVSLLATVPDDVRRSFAARVLGPVLDYDARHQAELRETVEAFLDCSGSWSKVAQLLHLHVNTVRYRIARVEELTGRDLGTFSDRVDIFLALRSR